MAQRYFFSLLLSGVLLGAAASSQAQAPAPVPQPATLLKAGLRLTHLHYAHDSKAWQLLLPVSLGAEYRVAPRFSLYGQLEADLLASSTVVRQRQARSSAFSAAALSLGLRHYYGRRPGAGSPAASPEFGQYLALEAAADWQQLTLKNNRGRGNNRQVVNTPTTLTPSLYALWGIQHRLRPHLLCDLNAGLGVQAPAHYSFERAGAANHWQAGAQVNIRLYFGY